MRVQVPPRAPTGNPLFASLSGYFYDEHLSLTENTAAYEKEAIRRALERTDSITEAARLLRISRQTLSYKIEKYRLN